MFYALWTRLFCQNWTVPEKMLVNYGVSQWNGRVTRLAIHCKESHQLPSWGGRAFPFMHVSIELEGLKLLTAVPKKRGRGCLQSSAGRWFAAQNPVMPTVKWEGSIRAFWNCQVSKKLFLPLLLKGYAQCEIPILKEEWKGGCNSTCRGRSRERQSRVLG